MHVGHQEWRRFETPWKTAGKTVRKGPMERRPGQSKVRMVGWGVGVERQPRRKAKAWVSIAAGGVSEAGEVGREGGKGAQKQKQKQKQTTDGIKGSPVCMPADSDGGSVARQSQAGPPPPMRQAREERTAVRRDAAWTRGGERCQISGVEVIYISVFGRCVCVCRPPSKSGSNFEGGLQHAERKTKCGGEEARMKRTIGS